MTVRPDDTAIRGAPDIPMGLPIVTPERLLDSEIMRDRINGALPDGALPFAQCRIAGIHYKNPARTLISYALKHDADEQTATQYVYARCFSPAQYPIAAEKARIKHWTASTDGPALTFLPESAAILYWFPNDERIEGLRGLVERKKLQRLFYAHLPMFPPETWRISDRSLRLRIVRHKPERRTVAWCRFRAHPHHSDGHEELFAYLGVYPMDRARAIWDLNTMLHEGTAGETDWGVPVPMGFAPEAGMIISKEFPGESLKMLLESTPSDNARDAVSRAGRMLAQLHHHRIPQVPVHGTREFLRQIDETEAVLRSMNPTDGDAMAKLATRLRDRLRRIIPAETALVHGDLHPGQIIMNSDRVAFLDFDRAHFGDPGLDIGNFLAQMWMSDSLAPASEREGLSRLFVDSYSDAAEWTITPDSLDTWEAFSLFRSAGVPLGRFETGWRRRLHGIVERALGLLA